MTRLIMVMVTLALLGGCNAAATKPEAAAETSAVAAVTPADKVFKRPLSVQAKMISELEWKGLARMGIYGSTEYVAKAVPGMAPENYTTFDDSIIIAINAGEIPGDLLAMMRDTIRKRVSAADRSYRFVSPDQAQAGIASIFSPVRAREGTTWELVVVVFDRARMASAMAEKPDVNPVDAIFRSAIRGMVSHLYPETDLNFAAGTSDAPTVDGIRKLYSRALANFLDPLIAEQVRQDDEVRK